MLTKPEPIGAEIAPDEDDLAMGLTVPNFFQEKNEPALRSQARWLERHLGMSDPFFARFLRTIYKDGWSPFISSDVRPILRQVPEDLGTLVPGLEARPVGPLTSTFADYLGFAEVGILGAMEGRDRLSAIPGHREAFSKLGRPLRQILLNGLAPAA